MERRREVAEVRAHRNLGRLLKVLTAVAGVALIGWALLSPWMSVAQVRTSGIRTSATNEILAEHGVTAGRPMIFLLDTDSVEEALETDPWVVEARVALKWPDEVVVGVVEREPRLWANTADGWILIADDGHIVPGPDSPDGRHGQIDLTEMSSHEVEGSELVLGAGEFLSALPLDLAPTVVMRLQSDELWTTVEGYEVRLGRPVEMREKAVSLMGLLLEDIAPGSTLVMIAPTHPAVESAISSGDVEDDDGTANEDASAEEADEGTRVQAP
jgi:hypothetical protein